MKNNKIWLGLFNGYNFDATQGNSGLHNGSILSNNQSISMNSTGTYTTKSVM